MISKILGEANSAFYKYIYVRNLNFYGMWKHFSLICVCMHEGKTYMKQSQRKQIVSAFLMLSPFLLNAEF